MSYRCIAASPVAAQAASPGRNGVLAVVRGDLPAGQQIVLVRPADGAIVRADGTQRRVLPRPAPFVDAVAPTCSPDGRRIAFTAVGFDVSSLPAWSSRGVFAVGTGRLAVWRMAADGSDRRRLTWSRSDQPDWSPGGTLIAYTRFAHGREEVWMMSATGAGRRRIALGSMPAWSPDGRSIAFVRGRRIFLVGARGGTPRKLPYAPRAADGRPVRLSMPAWQPLPR